MFSKITHIICCSKHAGSDVKYIIQKWIDLVDIGYSDEPLFRGTQWAALWSGAPDGLLYDQGHPMSLWHICSEQESGGWQNPQNRSQMLFEKFILSVKN